jgi:hypothetical protein
MSTKKCNQKNTHDQKREFSYVHLILAHQISVHNLLATVISMWRPDQVINPPPPQSDLSPKFPLIISCWWYSSILSTMFVGNGGSKSVYIYVPFDGAMGWIVWDFHRKQGHGELPEVHKPICTLLEPHTLKEKKKAMHQNNEYPITLQASSNFFLNLNWIYYADWIILFCSFQPCS